MVDDEGYTSVLKNALEYIKNTNGGATKENFIEDNAPIGAMLWHELTKLHLVKIDENGKLWINA